MDNLLAVKKDEIYIATDILAKELKRSHKIIINLVKTYENQLKKLGVLPFENALKTGNPKGGQPKKVYYLNETQYLFLIMNMRTKSNEKDLVLNLKIEISKQFVSMRKYILEQKTMKANQEYIETRGKSKLGRKQETDTIKLFVEYAKKQGSKSAEKYYMNISKMENKAFFILKEKFPNVREILNIKQLSKIIIADMIVKTALLEGMEKEMYYKDIFQLAKKRVVELSNSLGIKDILPSMKFTQSELPTT